MTEEVYESQPMPAMPGTPMHATEGSIKYQLETEDIIEQIEHTLKCELLFQDPKTGKFGYYTPENIQPLINERGVQSVLFELRGRINRIYSLSDLTDDDIANITIGVGEAIVDDFEDNWLSYEIKDEPSATKIRRLVTDAIYSTLKKARDGTYLKFLRSTHSTSEVQTMTGKPQQRQSNNDSVLDKLFRRP